MVNVHGVVDERRHSSCAGFSNEFGNLQEHKFREHRELSSTSLKKCQRTFRRNSDCETPGTFITIMDEINIGQRSSDQLGEKQKLVSTLIPFYVWIR